MKGVPTMDASPINASYVADLGLTTSDSSSSGGRSARLAAGTRVNGRYVVERLVGAGAMGVVYKVKDALHPERQVALKTLDGTRVHDDLISLFKAEFKTMTGLRHPNVAAVYDFESLAGTSHYFFTMEHVSGENLMASTEGAGLPRILDLLVQICRALAFVHSRSVIHFDLKPANVVVDGAGHVKVLDFGLAGARPIAGVTGGFVGTPAYMAPEMFAGRGGVDHRVDLYSLGVLLYQLLCRTLPFEAASISDIMQQHATTPIAFSEEALCRLPEWVRAVVIRLCAKDPAERFRSANAVVEAVNAGSNAAYEIETGATRQSYILSPRFVGREQELNRVQSHVSSRVMPKRAASSPMALVAGTGGVGKSRLLREVRHHCQLARLSFVEADCHEGAVSEFAPLVAAMRFILRIADSAGLDDLVQRYGGHLARLDPSLAADRGFARVASIGNADAERIAMFENIAMFFAQVAENVPFVVYFNDLQWARQGMLDWFGHVVRLIATREREGRIVPIALLGSFRDDEAHGSSLARQIERLQATGDVELVRLTPLSPEHVRDLIASMLGAQTLPADFVTRVVRETAGNPFFVEEVMRALVDRGTVFLDRGQWATRVTVGELELPRGVSEAFLRRLGALDLPERALVDVLAVVARPASADLLADVLERSVDETHATLLHLSQGGIAARVDGENGALTYSFAHDRMRETAYDALDAARRKDVHRALYTVFASEGDELRKAHLYELAEHAWHAGLTEEARRLSLEAGRLAKQALANGVALELLSRALELWDSGDFEGRRALTEDIADVHALLGSIDQAIAHYREVLAGTRDRLAAARLHRKVGYLYNQQGAHRQGLAELTQALAHFGERPAREGQLGAIVALGGAFLRHRLQRFLPWLVRKATSAEERLRCTELAETYMAASMNASYVEPVLNFAYAMRSANIAERLGPSLPLVRGYAFTAVVYGERLDYELAKDYARRAVSMAEEMRAPWHLAESKLWQSYVLTLGAEGGAALLAAQEARALFAKHGDLYLYGIANCLTLLNFVALGRLEEAATYVEDALQTLERTGVLAASNPVCMKCAAVRTELGDVEHGLEQQRMAVARAERLNAYLDWAHLYMAITLSAIGRDDEAIEHLRRSQVEHERTFITSFIGAPVYPLLARLLLAKVNRIPHSREQRHLLSDVRQLVKKGLAVTRRAQIYRPMALTVQAQLARYDGKHARATELFSEAIALCERRGNTLMQAEARYELGKCLIEPGPGANPAEGAKNLRKALALFEGAGARLSADRVRREHSALFATMPVLVDERAMDDSGADAERTRLRSP